MILLFAFILDDVIQLQSLGTLINPRQETSAFVSRISRQYFEIFSPFIGASPFAWGIREYRPMIALTRRLHNALILSVGPID